MGRKLDGRTRNVTISGFDDIVRDFTKFNDVKKRRMELLKLLDKPATELKKEVAKGTPIYKGNKFRSKRTGYKGLYIQLRLTAGTLQRSVQKFKAKRSANPRVDVGHTVLKRPRSLAQWIRNAKKWDKNGWYGMFLLYGTKGRVGNKGIDGKDYLTKIYNNNKINIETGMIKRLKRYIDRKL